jgi:hypothetical protein
VNKLMFWVGFGGAVASGAIGVVSDSWAYLVVWAAFSTMQWVALLRL